MRKACAVQHRRRRSDPHLCLGLGRDRLAGRRHTCGCRLLSRSSSRKAVRIHALFSVRIIMSSVSRVARHEISLACGLRVPPRRSRGLSQGPASNRGKQELSGPVSATCSLSLLLPSPSAAGQHMQLCFGQVLRPLGPHKAPELTSVTSMARLCVLGNCSLAITTDGTTVLSEPASSASCCLQGWMATASATTGVETTRSAAPRNEGA